MKRQASEKLSHWLGSRRRKPLVLRGARQVGKSTLARQFAKDQKLDLVELNLERHRNLDGVFATLDLERIISSLEAAAGKHIGDKSLLFLDEIQAAPHALAALRYFYEDRPSLPVIAAGSLLEFALADHTFSMPVGRIQYLHLGPMSFFEFLSERSSYEYEALCAWQLGQPFPLALHEKLKKRLREYLMVGGMPESVAAFLETERFDDVRTVQNGILTTYVDDFAKYARSTTLSDLQTIFESIPRMITRKLKYTNLLPAAKSTHVSTLVDLLIKSQLVRRVRKSDCAGLPLAAGVNPKFSKLLFLDVGLVSRLLGHDFGAFEQSSGEPLVNEGPLAEQFVGQHLQQDASYETLPGLFYWARESRKSNAEIDFVTTVGSRAIPVEVKSGASGSLKSMHQFAYERQSKIAVRFDLQPPSIQEIRTSISTAHGQQSVSYELINLPLYAAGRLPALLS